MVSSDPPPVEEARKPDMLEYEVQPHSRRCATIGRELQPGEKYYSVLVEERGRLIRRDYSREGWKGPPAEAFSFWTGRVPTREQSRKMRIDADLLLDCFQRLDGSAGPGKRKLRYVLAPLLGRGERLKI